MSVINSIVSWAIKKRLHQVELFLKHPIDTQRSTLYYLINKSKNTEWGKKFDYKTISNVDEFRNRVPISTYEELFPWIDRVLKGEQNVLWSTEIKWFSKSSGTTNAKSKLIPVSEESLEECHFKGGKDLSAFYLNNNPQSKLFAGKNLALGGSRTKLGSQNDKFVGDVSALIMENLPLWAEWIRVPDLKTALMEDYEKKLDLIIEKSLEKNVTNIAGVPTWTYVLIKKILDRTGQKDLLEVWPNFEVYFHGGVNFEPYRKLFKQIIPSDQVYYIDSYNASEGFFGVQDQLKSDELLLMLDYGIFYEFLPLEYLHDENPQTILLEDVEIGKNYALVISTNSGLWRYLIGDTIKFSSKSPYRFRISGRTKHFINAFGEELVIENAENAIKYACEINNCTITNFTAAPVYFGNDGFGAHQWLIEFEKEPDNLEQFTHDLDQKLKELNSDYEAKRSGDIALKSPQITQLEKGTFYNWMKSRGKLGGQNKVPRLSNDRQFVDSILEMVQPETI